MRSAADLRRWALAALGAAIVAGCGSSRPREPEPGVEDRIPVLLAQADSASSRGLQAEARDAYARVAKDAKAVGAPGFEARASLGAGLASLGLGDAESARRYLTRAVELLPSSAEAHVALGRFHAAIHHYRDAKAEYDRAAALDTTSAEPYYRLGQAYAEAGETQAAINALTRALARNPTHAGAQTALQAAMGKRDTAVGLPEGYGALGGRTTLSRAELGVMLAAELGLDPDHPGEMEGDVTEVRGTWGERWLRAAIGRGWLSPFPDGSFHLADPVTRGALALTLAQIERSLGPLAPPGGSSFPDLSTRHYLARAAALAVRMGLPLRSDGRFDPWTSATGTEALLSVKGVAREHGLRAIRPGEPGGAPVVK